MTVDVHTYLDGRRSVTTRAVDACPYWLATTGRVHRVKAVDVLWEAVGASFDRPRVLIHIACRSLWNPRFVGLTLARDGSPCPKCFAEEAA